MHKIRPVLIKIHSGSRANSLIFVLMLSAFMFALGCSNSSTEPDPPRPSLKLIQLDSFWVLNTDRLQHITVEVENINPYDLALLKKSSIICRIQFNSNDIAEFELFDDGNAGRWSDSGEFADSLSGDHVPLDNFFSRRISSKFANNSGEYIFTFILSDDNPLDSISAQVLVRDNSPPEFISHSEDDSVFSGGIGDIFKITLSDINGNDEIANAEVVIFRSSPPSSDAAYFEMERITDDRWSWNDKATISVGLATGNYSVAYRAQDTYLNQIEEWTYSDTFSVWMENLSSTINSIEGPDTVWIPQSESDTIYFDFTVTVEDDQSPTDLDTLILNLFSSDGVKLAKIPYIDGRSILDSIPLDGIYRPEFSANGGNQAPAEYDFKWTAIDKAGNTSETFETHLLILRSEENSTQSGNNNDYDKAIRKQSHSPFK